MKLQSGFRRWFKYCLSVVLLCLHFIFLCFSRAKRCTQHHFPSLQNEHTCHHEPLLHTQKQRHWKGHAGARRSVTAACVEYLLAGWSRDRDLDRERAWRSDRLWLALWSAASTVHSGQKASHASATEGGNDRRRWPAIKRHRLFLSRPSAVLQFLHQRSSTTDRFNQTAGPVPNDPRTGIGPLPGGWGQLSYCFYSFQTIMEITKITQKD